MKVLVTGASGFVGRNLVESFVERHDVSAPHRAGLDLLDEQAVCRYLGRNAFDVVVHAATVRASRKQPFPPNLLHDNLRMFRNLARHHDAFGRMLFLSSGAVYDRRRSLDLVSESEFGERIPEDDYGYSKYLCGSFIEGIGNIWELRPFGLFGPHEDWETRFVSNTCCRALWDLPLVVRRNAVFDYLDVRDLTKIVEWFFAAEPQYRAYNICGGQAMTLESMAGTVRQASGKDLPVILKVLEPGAGYSGSSERIMKELPFPIRPLIEGVGHLYRWYSQRKTLIDPSKLHFDG